MDPEIIEIFDDEEEEETREPQEIDIDRRAVLKPYITRVVDALGGYEGDQYRLGDEVYGCLKDLKKLWRKDDTDDDRTVARIFYETRVLPNDLIPILLATAGKGLVEDKRAIACADLMTAMTWPIDVAEELKELDEEIDGQADYTQLMESHIHYKAALLKTGVMKALFGIILPPLAKIPKERHERDGQIINVVLHLIRNLAFIKDLPANSTRSADNVELSSLQSKLVRVLEESHVLQLLLTIAANSDDDPLFNTWNALVLEIFYLLFRGIKPEDLAADQSKQPTANLQKLLAAENRKRQDVARKASTRHSRFGTTVTVQLKKPAEEGAVSRPIVLHRQQGIHQDAGALLDITKKGRAKKGNTVDELTREDNLSMEAKATLKQLADNFLEGCFNPFLAGLLKDIRAERAKISDKDNLRLLYVTKWFLEYFLTMRAKAAVSSKSSGEPNKWNFGLIAEVVERVWIVWVLKRMREAMEDKPKLWTELQAGMECLTQLFLLIDAMSSSEVEDPELSEAAELLLGQLIYQGEVLDISMSSLKVYKEGTQSLAYLDSSVHLAHALLRMLEKWSRKSGDGTYVRQKVSKRKKKRRGSSPVAENEEEGILAGDGGHSSEESDQEDTVHEVLFSFEAFEMKFASFDITQTLLTYLARYKDFSSPEKMKRVVGLMHRQAVKAKAEGLFFQVTTLDLFKTILSEQKSLPRDQPYKDLISLINFILRRFFKAMEESSFLAIEAFFPKNKSHWKEYSSWEPEEKPKRERNVAGKGKSGPTEVTVAKGFSFTEQIGIAIAALVDNDRKDLVVWTQDILRMAINKRKRAIDEVDGGKSDEESENEDDDEGEKVKNKEKRYQNPSEEARKAIADDAIPCVTEERAEAASKDAYLKLLWRLCKFIPREHDEDDEEAEMEWYIPSNLMPPGLEITRNVIMQFLETPFQLEDGKKLAQILRKKRATRRRRRSPSASGSGSEEDEDQPRAERKKRKEKEKAVYKSAAMIEDSDEEEGELDAFFERERLLRERMAAAAAASKEDGVQAVRPAGMRATGTKKRKKRKAVSDASDQETVAPPTRTEMPSEPAEESARPRPRPRPKPLPKKGKAPTADSTAQSSPPTSPRSRASSETGDGSAPLNIVADGDADADDVQVVADSRPKAKRFAARSSIAVDYDDEDEVEVVAPPAARRRATNRLFLSDSEDDG